jgi:hypothetical protein
MTQEAFAAAVGQLAQSSIPNLVFMARVEELLGVMEGSSVAPVDESGSQPRVVGAKNRRGKRRRGGPGRG